MVSVTRDFHRLTLMEYDWYLKKVPGGGWSDIRYRFGRGDTVRVIAGTFEGS